MGNRISSGGGSSSKPVITTIPATDALALVAREESMKQTTVPRVGAETPAPEEGELPGALAALGVEMGQASVPDAVQCWRFVADPDFWRRHAESHPMYKRVKMWLYVHNKFRSSATKIVHASENMHSGVMEGCSSTKTESAARSIERSLRTLLGKVDKHTDFEETQLFRFFTENLPEMADQIRSIQADHSEKQPENDALARINALRSAPTTAGGVSGGADVAAAEEVVDAVRVYAASLEKHLEREERVIVGPWLNIDAELYAKYRTYLVGKYRLVY